MRLEAPTREHRLRDRIVHRLVRLRLESVPDLILVCQHRPDFFGRPFLAWVDTSLRGASEWTQGERELMAALVSERNQCPFCVGTHGAPAAALMGEEVVRTVLSADLSGAEGAATDGTELAPALRAVLVFIQKLTLEPAEVDASDVERVVAAGVSPQALRDAVEVCAAFNVINRVAEGLAFEPLNEKARKFSVGFVTRRGYRVS